MSQKQKPARRVRDVKRSRVPQFRSSPPPPLVEPRTLEQALRADAGKILDPFPDPPAARPVQPDDATQMRQAAAWATSVNDRPVNKPADAPTSLGRYLDSLPSAANPTSELAARVADLVEQNLKLQTQLREQFLFKDGQSDVRDAGQQITRVEYAKNGPVPFPMDGEPHVVRRGSGVVATGGGPGALARLDILGADLNELEAVVERLEARLTAITESSETKPGANVLATPMAPSAIEQVIERLRTSVRHLTLRLEDLGDRVRA